MAWPMRSSARASGRFSVRDTVDCERRSACSGRRSIASLNNRIAAQGIGIVAIFAAGGDHQHAEADDLVQAMHDPPGYTWVANAGSQALSNVKPLFDLAQGHTLSRPARLNATATGFAPVTCRSTLVHNLA